MRPCVCLLLAAALWLSAPHAEARGRASWTQVEVRKGDDQERVGSSLKKLLVTASKKAKWGKGEKIELSARVTKLDWETRDDVVLVHVTVVGKIKGGESARAYIRIGGRPSEKRKLEKQALRIVADGLVTRLSDIARR